MLNSCLQTCGALQFYHPTLKILSFAMDYLPQMENKTVTKHAINERYAGYSMDDNEDEDCKVRHRQSNEIPTVYPTNHTYGPITVVTYNRSYDEE